MIVTDYLQRFLRRVAPKRFYCEDAQITTYNHGFLDDSRFRKAYERGIKATEGLDNHNRWRVHIVVWVARACASLEGDFVECGVNYRLTTSAIMEDLAWDRLKKSFWEIAAFEFFSTKLSALALILFSDHGHSGHDGIHKVWAEAAPRLGNVILSPPTGPGLIHILGKHQPALSG